MVSPATARRRRAVLVRPERRERADRVRERPGIVAGEALRRIEQRVEYRIRGEHGTAAGRRLVHDLVWRAGLHVVHDRVVRGEQPWHLGAGDGVAKRDPAVERELAREPLE